MIRRPPSVMAAVLVFLVAVSAAVGDGFGHDGQDDGHPQATGKAVFDEAEALRLSQAAIGRAIGDPVFRDSGGRAVNLGDFRGRPLVLNFIYTGCAQSCNVMTAMLAGVFDTARDALGTDSFNAVTIGFDVANDTPERMRTYARQRGIVDRTHWRFLSGDAETVDALARTVGFQAFASPKGFDHIDQVTIIDSDGRVHTQVYGETFDKPLLVEPLKAMVLGTPAPFRSVADLIKKVRLFCTLYDPAADRYVFDYSLFIQLSAGFIILGGVAIFLARQLWLMRRRRREGGSLV